MLLRQKQYTYVDTDDNRVLEVPFETGGFWEKGNFEARYPGTDNPWEGSGTAAPYDQRFYIVLNVAVGGVSGYFPDGVVRLSIGIGYHCPHGR